MRGWGGEGKKRDRKGGRRREPHLWRHRIPRAFQTALKSQRSLDHGFQAAALHPSSKSNSHFKRKLPRGVTQVMPCEPLGTVSGGRHMARREEGRDVNGNTTLSLQG